MRSQTAFLKKFVEAAKFDFEVVLTAGLNFLTKIWAQKDSLNRMVENGTDVTAIVTGDADRAAITECIRAWEGCKKAKRDAKEAFEQHAASIHHLNRLIKLSFDTLWEENVPMLSDYIQLDASQMEDETKQLMESLSDVTFDKHLEESSWKATLGDDATEEKVHMAVQVHLADLKGMKIHALSEKMAAVLWLQ